jgi:hypothetical protein
MLTIYKYPLAIRDEQDVIAPVGARWLSVDEQFGQLCAWALVDPEAPVRPHRFYVVGTGNPADHVLGKAHLGTVLQLGDGFVWHVFTAAV